MCFCPVGLQSKYIVQRYRNRKLRFKVNIVSCQNETYTDDEKYNIIIAILSYENLNNADMLKIIQVNANSQLRVQELIIQNVFNGRLKMYLVVEVD